MVNKPNIILFAPTIHTGGGTERVLINLGNELITRGYDITIAVSIIGENNLYEVHNSLRIKQFNYGKYRSNFPGSISLKIIDKLFGKVFWESFLKNITQPHTIAIIAFSNGITINCFNTRFRNSLIAFEHLPFWISNKYPKLQKKIQAIYPFLNHVIVLTDHEKEVYSKLGCKNVRVIQNIYTFLPDLPAKLDNKCVLSIGHFNEQKRRDLLIDAWRLVYAKHRDWKLIIVGEGHLKDQIINQIADSGIQSSVQIIEPTKDIINYYLDSSIYVMSSEYEALPLVLIEAKVSGLPIVSFDIISGPNEIICNGKDGFLVDFPNTNDMANKINLLIENETLRKEFGFSARHDALNRFSPDKIYKIWENFLAEL